MKKKQAKLSITIATGDAHPAFLKDPKTLADKLLACCGLIAISAAKSLKEEDLIIHTAILGGQRVSSWAYFEETADARYVNITLQKSGTQPKPQANQSNGFCEAAKPTDILECTGNDALKNQLNIINMASNKISANNISTADRQTAKLCSIKLLGTVAKALQKACLSSNEVSSDAFEKIIIRQTNDIRTDTTRLSGGSL